MNDRASSNFSKYRILGLVGRGQFGKVLCARMRDTGKLVALKELENNRFPTSKLLRELRFLLTLQHDNIVACTALVHHQKYRYLVMEYCEGGTLRDLMNHSKSLSVQQCFELVHDILLGLEHAHESSIIHCDIKPENVLLKVTSVGWQAKISDFGIARLSQEIDSDSNNTGSPGYMAPERFYGQFSVSSDLYAVGIILYELLVGKRPFSGMPTELMNAHLNYRVIIPEFLPRSLASIITRSLEKLPKRRYSSASEMRRELVAAFQSEDFSKIQTGLDEERCTTFFLSQKAQHFAHKDLPNKVVAMIGTEKSRFYSSSSFTLNWHSLSLEQEEQIIKSEHEIRAIAFARKTLFVLTKHSIYQFIQGKPKFLYQASPDKAFDWAVSPEGDWLAIATGKQLEIRNLVYGRAMRLEFSSRALSCMIAFDRHHLLAIANKPETKESRAVIISRRCNIMQRLSLPIQVGSGIATFMGDRVLLLEAGNRRNIYLLDIKPYRLSRLPLPYEVSILTATPWGYALAGNYNEYQTVLMLLDLRGNSIGNLIIDGEVTAIAPIDINLLAIATVELAGCKIYAIDLKKLDVDLVF